MDCTDDLRVIERSLWETQTVQNMVRPLDEIPTVEESTNLVEIITRLETEGLQRVTVLSPAGAVAGLIDRGDILRSLAQKLNLRIADADIKRVKEEGSYPPGLQLGTIAKSTK